MDGVASPVGLHEIGLLEVVDQIVSTRRRKRKMDLTENITDKERREVLGDALKVYNFLQEKSIDTDTKVLIEYKKGLIKMTEEINLPL
jgi:hypothetical protein